MNVINEEAVRTEYPTWTVCEQSTVQFVLTFLFLTPFFFFLNPSIHLYNSEESATFPYHTPNNNKPLICKDVTCTAG